MPLHNDDTILDDAVLFRGLPPLPNWIKTTGGHTRPTSLAFYSSDQEISYFIDAPGMLAELFRIFPGYKFAAVPADVLRSVGFAIERRPLECPTDFRCDPACHVVAGPPQQIDRREHQRLAGMVAKHPNVRVVSQESTQHQ